MGNMGYCRFQNTVGDLQDCNEHLWDTLSRDEHRARAWLIRICKNIADEVDDDEWLMDITFEDDDKED